MTSDRIEPPFVSWWRRLRNLIRSLIEEGGPDVT